MVLEAAPQTSADAPLSSGSPSAARPEDADEVARTCLRRQDFSEQACLQVLRGCFDKPTENRRRSVLGRSGPVNYHILGFFASRTGIGLTEGTKKFPSVCKYLNMWLLHYFPQDLWCSIAISFNMVTQVHADQLNDPVIPNKCISLGPHTGGRLWLQDASGTVKFRDTKGKTYMGRQVDIHMKPCTFVPHQLHGSCLDPFRGERWVLVAYVPEAFSQARQAFEESLRDLAFPIGDHVQSRTVRILPELLDSPGARTVHCDRPSDATSWTPKRFCDNRSLAELLVAARPVVWRGAGDLLQVSWAQGPPGRWLLLDLCAGYSGLCIAALSTGLHCWALAVESDEQACKAARAVMPSIVHVSRISDLDVEVLLPFLRRRQPRGILIGTGASSQPPLLLAQVDQARMRFLSGLLSGSVALLIHFGTMPNAATWRFLSSLSLFLMGRTIPVPRSLNGWMPSPLWCKPPIAGGCRGTVLTGCGAIAAH